MHYFRVSRSSTEADASRDSNVFPIHTEKPTMLNWMRDLNFVKLERFLLCLALVFPSIVLLTGSHPTCALFETHPHIKQIGMEFTTDVDYMSLDHAYDFLWDELSLREKGGGMIRSKENSNGGEERIAQITMYELQPYISLARNLK
jgi:hypothetical protein